MVVALENIENPDEPVDLFSFINEALEYFVEEEGWSPIYAFQVIMKQGSEVGLAELRKHSLKTILDTPTPEVMMQNIDFHKDRYTRRDVKILVERIGDVLSTYKDTEGIRKLKRDLIRISMHNN